MRRRIFMVKPTIPRLSRLALAVGIGCATAVVGMPAWGQDVDDEVTVTGSRIRRDTFNSVAPVQLVTRDEVTLAGFTSTTEALQGTAITTGAAQINNAFGGFVTDGGPGANTLSLRGLGAGRTLVLINGRRVAPSGTRGAVGSADLNVLPNAIIDHIEVLKDGASSIYGSDAIAGVVNVVTTSEVDDVTLEVQFNDPSDGGGEQRRVSVVGGLSGERWNFGGSLEFYDRANLRLAQRDWTLCNTDNLTNPTTGAPLDFIDPLTGRPKCYPITGTGSNGVTINTIGTSAATGVGAAGSVGTAFNRWRPNAAVTTGVVGYEGVGGGANSLNVRDTFDPRTLNRSLISPAEHSNLFLQGGYGLEALGDGRLYFELLATRRESEQTGYRQLSLDYRLGSPVIPADLAFSNFAPDQGTSQGNRVGVRAFIGFGNDTSAQTVDYYKPMVGLTGDIGSEWRYDLNFSASRADAQYFQESFLIDKVTLASNVVTAPPGFDPTLVRNGLTCSNNVNPDPLFPNAGRCIPFPLLTPAVVGSTLPQDFVDYIWRDVVGNTSYDEDIIAATFDGPIATLPAGQVQTVFGVEHRRTKIDDTPDPNSINANLYNLTSATPTRGKDKVNEVFAEIEVPLLSGEPGANDLRINGSWRYTDYDSYGSDDTYKIGLMWSPTEWISLRYTRGTSFRAPALFEQFQGPTSGFLSQAGDPCNNWGALPVGTPRRTNCEAELPTAPAFQQNSSIRVFSEGGAAAGLSAETSDNITYGLVIQPPLGDKSDLSIAVDVFDIEINNGVDQAGGGNILQRCYDDPQFRAGGAFCRLVTRNPATNALTVSNAHTNIASQIAEGIDYTLRFEHELGEGMFLLQAQATYYRSQANKLFEDEPFDELNGTINNPKNIATLDFTYAWSNWRVRYGIDWIDDMDSYAFLGLTRPTQFDFDVADYQEQYASVRYTNDDWQWTAGVRNLADEVPPTISFGAYNRVGNAPLYSGYDYFGREVFLQLAKQF
jgi:outer membrane receptor protein involved in Fe transport